MKEGMTEAHRMLIAIKDRFKDDPKTYNHFEMNLKILYREKMKREWKMKIAKGADKDEIENENQE
jgi:hypothetical protein